MQKAMLLAKFIAATTFGLSVFTFASTASATNLVPNQEGEIKTTNLGCLADSPCIDTATLPFAYKVTSLEYDFDGKGSKFDPSRLFVDDRSTTNNYAQNPVTGQFGITFGTTDAGTNPPPNQYWFRSVAYADGQPFENGQLEVGRFLFDFLDKTVASVTFDLFDVEDADITKILKVNGQNVGSQFVAQAGPNGNRQQITIFNVNNFEIQLGNPGPDSKFTHTGDGVAMRASVPEPSTVISLGALAVAGMFASRQRKKVNIG
jgi:PEP-CTERM motif